MVMVDEDEAELVGVMVPAAEEVVEVG
jgi:hypothetical protein